MPLTYESNQYQIPRGKVFFDPYNASEELTGERYIGNCPGITINISSEKSDHYNSEGGLREKDASILVQVDRTGTLNCDNMSLANLQLFLSGTQDTVTQASTPITNEPHTVQQGRYYQLGQSTSNPAGVRNIGSVVVTDTAGLTTYVAGTDYNIDTTLGRIQILAGAIVDDQIIHVDYTPTATSWERVKTGSTAELYGALRIVADNASGDNRDFYMPKVSLTPNGELPIVAEGIEFASMAFALEVLKPANAEAIYVDGRPAA
jgi:hypothetical protein